MNFEEEIYSELIRFFDLTDFRVTPSGFEFIFQNMFVPFREVRKEFDRKGFYIFLRKKGEHKIGLLVKAPPQKEESLKVPLILLGLTFITTTWAGLNYSYSLVKAGYLPNAWVGALSFSLSLLFILGGHEMGHKFASIVHNVRASGPFFIPVPPFILPLGTMGAVIKMKSPAPDRSSEIYLGASGPIAGFLLSIPILIIGIKLSIPVDLSSYTSGKEILIFGEPVIFRAIKGMIFNLSSNQNLILHPLAFSGWVGLFVTALNLIPLGQLDGGHVLRALIGGNNFRKTSAFIIGVLLISGILYWQGWMVWAFIGIFFSLAGNPGPLDELSEVEPHARTIAIICAIVLILSFMPIPVKYMKIP